MTAPRLTPSAIATPPTSLQAVAITAVDPVSGTAQGLTPQRSPAVINIKYPVGAVHVVPCVGQQWLVRRIGLSWALDRQLPGGTEMLLNVQANPTQGMTQLGSSGVGSGPTLINGTTVSVLAPLQLQAYETTALPSAAQAGLGALAYDLTLSQVVFSDGSQWNPITSSSSGTTVSGQVFGQAPAGDENGTNTVFTTAQSFAPGSTRVYRNGLREQLGVGYTETPPSTITFSTAPLSSDTIEVDYAVQTSS